MSDSSLVLGVAFTGPVKGLCADAIGGIGSSRGLGRGGGDSPTPHVAPMAWYVSDMSACPPPPPPLRFVALTIGVSAVCESGGFPEAQLSLLRMELALGRPGKVRASSATPRLHGAAPLLSSGGWSATAWGSCLLSCSLVVRLAQELVLPRLGADKCEHKHGVVGQATNVVRAGLWGDVARGWGGVVRLRRPPGAAPRLSGVAAFVATGIGFSKSTPMRPLPANCDGEGLASVMLGCSVPLPLPHSGAHASPMCSRGGGALEGVACHEVKFLASCSV